MTVHNHIYTRSVAEASLWDLTAAVERHGRAEKSLTCVFRQGRVHGKTYPMSAGGSSVERSGGSTWAIVPCHCYQWLAQRL